jgi:hypothetical protein
LRRGEPLPDVRCGTWFGVIVAEEETKQRFKVGSV